MSHKPRRVLATSAEPNVGRAPRKHVWGGPPRPGRGVGWDRESPGPGRSEAWGPSLPHYVAHLLRDPARGRPHSGFCLSPCQIRHLASCEGQLPRGPGLGHHPRCAGRSANVAGHGKRWEDVSWRLEAPEGHSVVSHRKCSGPGPCTGVDERPVRLGPRQRVTGHQRR